MADAKALDLFQAYNEGKLRSGWRIYCIFFF